MKREVYHRVRTHASRPIPKHPCHLVVQESSSYLHCPTRASTSIPVIFLTTQGTTGKDRSTKDNPCDLPDCPGDYRKGQKYQGQSL